MEKLLSALSVVLGLGLASAQQVATNKTTTAPPAKVVKMETAKKEVSVKPTLETKAKPASSNSAIKMKKDGTPDKRYKANRHLKKDGTPDRRYKNK